MKYVRFVVDGEECWGRLGGDRIRHVDGDILGRPRESGREFAVTQAKLLPPAKPTKIVCLGIDIGRLLIAGRPSASQAIDTNP